MIHLDTSVLVDALTGPRRSAPALRGVLDQGERIGIATLVLYEWLRGPRREAEGSTRGKLVLRVVEGDRSTDNGGSRGRAAAPRFAERSLR